MALSPGARLGVYEVTARIDEGGMGVVWRARDTRLQRDVALKVLPDTFAGDPDRLARFEREARTLASLNHPNIAQVYGLEAFQESSTAGSPAQVLVMELVERPTLADRIRQGAIPLDEALPIARQIAEALEAAHEQGIIHRDLKPANVKVRQDGTVKVLDFGLAKAMGPAAGSTGGSQAPTITTPAMTQAGVILGTAAYMSPEQARGKPVDRRTDLWAFGCVLYEMLTGRQAFDGEDVMALLARIQEREPDLTALPARTPPAIRRLIRRCLVKDPRQRLSEASTARLEIDEARTAPEDAPVTTAIGPWWRRALMPASLVLMASLATVAMAIVLLAVGWGVRPSPPAGPLTRWTHLLPEGVSFRSGGHLVAIAPDGSRFVYNSDSGLRLRERDNVADRVIPGTTEHHVTNPFFSPDGLFLGFWDPDANQLRRIAVSGGPSIPLTPRATSPLGATWEADDTILYGQPDGIWRVSASGGEPEQVIVTEAGEQAQGPQLLPGGEWVLFTLARGSGSTRWNEAEIVVQSLVTDERKVIHEGGSDVRYLPTGHLLYAHQDALYAVPFDVSRLETTGRPSPVVEDILRADTPAINEGAAMAAVAADGTLVYVPGAVGVGSRVLVRVDADGNEQPVALPAAAYQALRVAPEGRRVAVEVLSEEGTAIWVADLTRRMTASPVTSVDDEEESAPVWSPDGQHVIYAALRDGVWGFYRRLANGTGEEELLAQVEGANTLAAGNWSPDGTSLVFTMLTDETSRDVGVLSLDGEPSWRALLDSGNDEWMPVISPDGGWLAYVSDERVRDEVYLQRFPDLGDRRRVSNNGGLDPVWAPNGRALYYLGTRGSGGADEMAVVTVAPGPPLLIGTPDVLFAYGPYLRPLGLRRWYDVMPDRDEFLMVTSADATSNDAPEPQVITVQNWFEELKRLVPTP